MHEKIFADPLNEHITKDSFAKERQTIINHVERLRDHPHDTKIIVGALLILIGLLLYVHFVFDTDSGALTFAFLCLIPLFIYWEYINKLQNNTALYLLCEKNNFVFNPETNHHRALKLGQLFPDVFHRGDPTKRSVYNQIWGYTGENQEVSFWSGIFHYETNLTYDQHGDRRNPLDSSAQITIPPLSRIGIMYALLSKTISPHRTTDRNESVFEKPVFIMELDRIMPASFILLTDGRRRDMTTESIAFNQKFRIRMHNDSKEAQHKVIQALSPSIQVRLIDFAHTFSIDSIAFQHNCLVVMFDKSAWETQHTNFFKHATIDERDVQHFTDLLNAMIALPVEMRKYLD